MGIDEEYEEAVKRGDEQAAFDLALQQAFSKGYDIPAWHGTYS